MLTKPQLQLQANLLTKFLDFKKSTLSPSIYKLYNFCLNSFVTHYEISADGINSYLANLSCGNAKGNYHQIINTFVRWLVKMGYLEQNPMDKVDKPVRAKRLLPSITEEQLEVILRQADNLRDRAIIMLFFESGMRLNELSNIKLEDINWESHTITIIGKGNKQRRAPFSSRSEKLLRACLSEYSPNGDNIWGMYRWGIQTMVKRLSKKTGIKFSCHAFRRGFACNLHRKGLSTLDIMHLGGWEDLTMALRYTRSITFDDCLIHYKQANQD